MNLIKHASPISFGSRNKSSICSKCCNKNLYLALVNWFYTRHMEIFLGWTRLTNIELLTHTYLQLHKLQLCTVATLYLNLCKPKHTGSEHQVHPILTCTPSNSTLKTFPWQFSFFWPTNYIMLLLGCILIWIRVEVEFRIKWNALCSFVTD